MDELWKPDLFVDRLIEFKEVSVLDKMRGLSLVGNDTLQFFTAAIATMSCHMLFDVRTLWT